MIPIRRLLAADAAAFRAIRLRALKDHPEAFAAAWEDEVQKPLAWFETILDQGFLVGAEGGAGALLGMAGLDIPTGAKKRHKGTLWSMYVAPEARRAGLGERLIAAVIMEATGRVEQLDLAAASGNDAAMALYRRMGFEVHGVDPRALKIGEGYIDDILMSRRLDR